LAASVARLSGDDWQEWANQLLSCHYGPVEYQTIPDRDRGDAGIEGFTVSNGHAFQAYGCEEPVSTQERYEKQRTKMTNDLRKFVENEKALLKLFGTVKISRWVLFVPYFDSKEIVGHASVKTAEVVKAKLPYVDTNFRVTVVQESDFSVARDQLLNASSSKLDIKAEPVTTEGLGEWITSNDALASALTRKLRKLPTLKSEDVRATFRERVLRWYLDGQSVLAELRKYPLVYEKVIRTKAHRENYLVMASLSNSAPHDILSSAINQMRETLLAEAKELHLFSAETLVFEAVADWLVRCPLDFPELVDG
jgi:hypothetical protein